MGLDPAGFPEEIDRKNRQPIPRFAGILCSRDGLATILIIGRGNREVRTSPRKMNAKFCRKPAIGKPLKLARNFKTGRSSSQGSRAFFLKEEGELVAGNVLLSKVESASFSMPVLPENASVGRRWRFRRNLVIYIASQNGASQRLLADVFDLPHSRIAAILKEFRLKYAP